MVRIAPVKLQYNPRTLWFDPGDFEIKAGQKVIVNTQRGIEYGTSGALMDVDEQAIEALNSPLKPIERLATQEDIDRAQDLLRMGQEALPIFKQMVAESGKVMRPVLVEYLFGEDKAIFFFEADERVDFRDLVRKLAQQFQIRVDMRQIGVRDEARLVGGLGHCGQELCCKRLGGEFNPVSIRMAKEQDLSLNPVKISGVCGRLMCCLRYEYDAYKEFHGRCPKMNAKINTPEGMAKVTSLDVPREKVTISMEEDHKRHTFPLAAFDPAPEGTKRPNTIGEEAFDEYTHVDPFAGTIGAGIGVLGAAKFTGVDKLGTPVATHNPKSKKKEDDSAESKKSNGRKRRSRGGRNKNNNQQDKTTQDGSKQSGKSNQQNKSNQSKQDSSGSGGQKRRRRRSGQGKSNAQNSNSTQTTSQKQGNAAQKSSVRPGQKSSALRSKSQDGAKTTNQNGTGEHRRTRRRSHKTGGSGNEG